MIQHLKSYNLYSRFLFIGLILLASCGVSEDAARNSSQGQTESRDQPTKPSKSMLTVIPTWTNTPLSVSTRLATPLPTTSTISESTPVAYHLSLLPKATVVTVSLPQTLDKTPITKLPQKQDDITWVALNDSHIFWTTITEPGVIFRFPLHGVYSENSIEKIVNTQFKQGTLNLYIQFLVNNDWLIYIDTAYQAEATPWRLQALNLKTGVAQTILENLDLTWSVPDITFDGEHIAWTLLDASQKTNKCTETVLTVYTLINQQQRKLDRKCIDKNYIWGLPALSSNRIVAERTTPELKNDIYLYDLATGVSTPLTSNGHSSMPSFAYPWIVWKDAVRYEGASQTILYNLENREQKTIGLGLTLDKPTLATKRWLYWNNETTNTNPVYLYDLTQGVVHLIAQQNSHKELIGPVALSGNTVAWWRLALDARDIPDGGFLEWESLPR